MRYLAQASDAQLRIGESILTIVVMDSGLALRAPRNDEGMMEWRANYLRRQWHGPGVVAIDPVGICLAVKPGVRPRRLLDPHGTVFPASLKPSKRIRHAITFDT